MCGGNQDAIYNLWWHVMDFRAIDLLLFPPPHKGPSSQEMMVCFWLRSYNKAYPAA
jgi:hypothetical protein